MVRIAAVDPGLDGALACLETDRGGAITEITIAEMPTIALPGRRIVDGAVLANWFTVCHPDICIVEQVSSRPGQGVVSVFSFGRALGTVEGVLHALLVPLERVTPQVWQRATGALGLKDPRGRAYELLPQSRIMLDGKTKKHGIGCADALLMALWWITTKQGGRKAETGSVGVW